MNSTRELLMAFTSGDAEASERLFDTVYADLKRMAHSRLYRGGRLAGLDTTALVHESYLRLVQQKQLAAQDKPAFFSYVGRVMRSVVIDHIRERRSQRRGGGEVFVTLTTGVEGEALNDDRLLSVDAALDALERIAPRHHQLVLMRYFAGLSVREVAEIQGTSTRTVEREWQKARAFLHKLMEEGKAEVIACRSRT